jgi:hypothetical protein
LMNDVLLDQWSFLALRYQKNRYQPVAFTI